MKASIEGLETAIREEAVKAVSDWYHPKVQAGFDNLSDAVQARLKVDEQNILDAANLAGKLTDMIHDLRRRVEALEASEVVHTVERDASGRMTGARSRRERVA